MIKRRSWRNARDPVGLDKARQKINQQLSSFVRKLGFIAIRYKEFEPAGVDYFFGKDKIIKEFGAVLAGRTEKPPQRHLAKSLYPFQRIQIDHIQMPKSGRYEYALVIVDMFSGWPEAYPVANMTAKTTVKRLLTEVICRYGVPEVIESDQGPAFTAVLAKEIWTALGVTLSFHTPYHPQSSGKVEHSEVITGTHQLLPGDWVLVKKFVRKTPLEPRYEGPFQVLLITATSVKLEGKATWVHASHCKKVPPPDDQEPTQ
ncbi:uncharacterized protein O3C94_016555 [Discoglossus pictus]